MHVYSIYEISKIFSHDQPWELIMNLNSRKLKSRIIILFQFILRWVISGRLNLTIIIKSFRLKMQALTEDNFKVLIRVRPLNCREKEEMSAYEQSQSKRMKGSSTKMTKMNPSIYSFYTKFYNCNIEEIIKI